MSNERPNPDYSFLYKDSIPAIDQSGTAPIIPALHRTANFSFFDLKAMQSALHNESESWLYTRGNNPTTNLVCEKLAALECTDKALLFGSGMAAISAGILHFVKKDAHIVCVANPYSWTSWMFTDWLKKFGIEVSYVEGVDPEDFRRASKENTVLYFLESPSSFTFAMQDLRAVALIAKELGIATMIDNSCASPINQQPHTLGIDLVAHSASKYLGGHSDIIAGVLCGSEELIKAIFKTTYQGLGGILSPADAWLLLRGLRTLPIRMEQIAKTTEHLVAELHLDKNIAQVYYCWHKSHPQFDLAKQQMRRGAGQFTIQLKTKSHKAVELFCNSLQHFKLAVSWGGFESLVIPAIAKKNNTLHPGIVRFCAGFEPPELLLSDIKQALEKANIN